MIVVRQLVLFGIAGVLGFLVDAGVLRALVSGVHANAYVARLLSFLCAATATWVFNRSHTFRGVRKYSLFGEWSRYLLAMCGGFALNYATYAFLYYHLAVVKTWPEIGVAAGSLGGMVTNYLVSRYWIYSHRRAGD